MVQHVSNIARAALQSNIAAPRRDWQNSILSWQKLDSCNWRYSIAIARNNNDGIKLIKTMLVHFICGISSHKKLRLLESLQIVSVWVFKYFSSTLNKKQANLQIHLLFITYVDGNSVFFCNHSCEFSKTTLQ